VHAGTYREKCGFQKTLFSVERLFSVVLKSSHTLRRVAASNAALRLSLSKAWVWLLLHLSPPVFDGRDSLSPKSSLATAWPSPRHGLEAYLSDGPIHKKAVCKSR